VCIWWCEYWDHLCVCVCVCVSVCLSVSKTTNERVLCMSTKLGKGMDQCWSSRSVDPFLDEDPGQLCHFSEHFEIGHFTIFSSICRTFTKLGDIIDTSKGTHPLHLGSFPDLDQSEYLPDPFPGSRSEFGQSSVWITGMQVCIPLGTQFNFNYW